MAAVSVYLTLNNKESLVAVLNGLLASDVLSTLPNPTMALVIPLTVPVNVGEAVFAFKLILADKLAVSLSNRLLNIASVSAFLKYPVVPVPVPVNIVVKLTILLDKLTVSRANRFVNMAAVSLFCTKKEVSRLILLFNIAKVSAYFTDPDSGDEIEPNTA